MLLIDEIDRADEPLRRFCSNARRVSGDDPRARHDPRETAPRGHHHLESHARTFRRVAPALSVSVARLSVFRTRTRDSACARAGLDARLAEQIARFMEWLREQPFQKVPGTAESFDWALALIRFHRDAIDAQDARTTWAVS